MVSCSDLLRSLLLDLRELRENLTFNREGFFLDVIGPGSRISLMLSVFTCLPGCYRSLLVYILTLWLDGCLNWGLDGCLNWRLDAKPLKVFFNHIIM